MNKIFILETQNFINNQKITNDGRKQKQHHHTRP